MPEPALFVVLRTDTKHGCLIQKTWIRPPHDDRYPHPNDYRAIKKIKEPGFYSAQVVGESAFEVQRLISLDDGFGRLMEPDPECRTVARLSMSKEAAMSDPITWEYDDLYGHLTIKVGHTTVVEWWCNEDLEDQLSDFRAIFEAGRQYENQRLMRIASDKERPTATCECGRVYGLEDLDTCPVISHTCLCGASYLISATSIRQVDFGIYEFWKIHPGKCRVCEGRGTGHFGGDHDIDDPETTCPKCLGTGKRVTRIGGNQ